MSAPTLLEVPEAAAGPARVWIAWERQRRSLNLSRRLRARLLLCIDEGRGLLRYPLSALRTLRELGRSRGATVFVQNPSMLLAALACLVKPLFGYRLIVDRHSNFGFLAGRNAGLKRRLSDLLSGYTLRRADLTIVTNARLAEYVEAEGGRAFVLPDPFPEVPSGDPGGGDTQEAPENAPAGRSDRWPASAAPKPIEILFVSSWAFDEPIAATIEACRRLEGQAVVRITGRPKAEYAELLAGAPANFVPTGFVPDGEYFALMARCDAVMAVTSRDATLVCGAYEAAALGKPMILGDTPTLRDYFSLGAVYTDSTPEDLAARIGDLIADLPRFTREAGRLRALRGEQWETRLRILERELTLN